MFSYSSLTSAYWNVDKDAHILTVSHVFDACKNQVQIKTERTEPVRLHQILRFHFKKMDKISFQSAWLQRKKKWNVKQDYPRGLRFSRRRNIYLIRFLHSVFFTELLHFLINLKTSKGRTIFNGLNLAAPSNFAACFISL